MPDSSPPGGSGPGDLGRLRRMYIPDYFRPSDEEVRAACSRPRARSTSSRRRRAACSRPCCRWSTTSPELAAGAWRVRGAAGSRRDQERSVARAGDRRGAGHRPRAGRLHHAHLVRRQARARPGRPHLELHADPRLRPPRHPRRPGLAGGERAPARRRPTRQRRRRRGASTTRRGPTSRASSGRSSASSC